MHYPLTSYDLWKTNKPEAPFYPLVCTNCGQRIDEIEDHAEDEPHCLDELTQEWVGKLEFDYSYDYRYDDPDLP